MDPDTSLQLAIDRVYQSFAIYSQPMEWQASPLRDPIELQVLISKPAERQSADELIGYATCAMTTVGTVKDYKYFLPRIMELAVATGIIEPEIIALKLLHGRWLDWPPAEKNAVIDVFYAAWFQALNEHPDAYLANGWFCGIAILDLDIRTAMQTWQAASSSDAILQLAQLLSTNALLDKETDERGYWTYTKDGIYQAARDWILSEDIHASLKNARLSTANQDVWMLDRALETRNQFIRLFPRH